VSFFVFVAQYYEERLHWYEHLDLTRCAETALLDVAGEASALHKFLTDILEEGYTTTVNRLVEQTDAFNRLQRFLSTVLPPLHPPAATLASQNAGVDDRKGCLSPLDLCTACPAHLRSAYPVAPGYTPHSLGTHLATTLRHASTRIKASHDWAEICRPL
jgi:hypothetical protein